MTPTPSGAVRLPYEITDSIVQRLISKLWVVPSNCDANEFVRTREALQYALDRRVGEADRRKVAEYSAANDKRLYQTMWGIYGRRSGDAHRPWFATRPSPKAEPAEPEIRVSEMMIKAGDAVRACWFANPKEPASSAAIYRAMESQRLKDLGGAACAAEQKGVELTYGLHHIHRRRDDPK